MHQVDVAGAAIYAVELALWIGGMLLGVAFNLRQWILNRRGTQRASVAIALDSATNASGGVDQSTTQATELDTQSSIGSSDSATSVFNTVGLRQRALRFFMVRDRLQEA